MNTLKIRNRQTNWDTTLILAKDEYLPCKIADELRQIGVPWKGIARDYSNLMRADEAEAFTETNREMGKSIIISKLGKGAEDSIMHQLELLTLEILETRKPGFTIADSTKLKKALLTSARKTMGKIEKYFTRPHGQKKSGKMNKSPGDPLGIGTTLGCS